MMSIPANEAKKARRGEQSDIHATNANDGSLTTRYAATTESNENKWKKRLHSLRRSLTKKRIPDSKARQRAKGGKTEENFRIQEVDVEIYCDNNTVQQAASPSANIKTTTSSIANGKLSSNEKPKLDELISCDHNKGTVKKRKGFMRRTKDHTVRGSKRLSTSESAQDLQNGQSVSVHQDVDIHNRPVTESVVKRRKNTKTNRKNTKSMLIFPSWVKSLGRTSGKNAKLKSRGLSVSTGNFNERENSFKLLTDVRLLRDPGYVSSSADTLEGDESEKYSSLRRSRASLIEIKWHKNSRSESNLTSPLRNRCPPKDTLITSPRAQQSDTQDVLPCNNYEKSNAGISNGVHTSHVGSQENEDWKITEINGSVVDGRDSESSGERGVRSSKTPEDDDAYLTAEEDIGQDKLDSMLQENDSTGDIKSVDNAVAVEDAVDSSEKPQTKHKSVDTRTYSDAYVTKKQKVLSSSASLPYGMSSNDTQNDSSKPVNNALPKTTLNKIPKSLSQSQPIRKISNTSRQTPMESHLCSGISCCDTLCKNNSTFTADSVEQNVPTGYTFLLGPSNNSVVRTLRSPTIGTRLLSPTDSGYDVVFTRPPQKPAPKPPSQMKSRSQSLTTLGAKFPILSEQLHLNETSSLRKLNDSCGENLCELLSQSKNRSQSSEGVYVGIFGEQGVILRKKGVTSRQKRVLSMPAELLENVMEVEIPEATNMSTDSSLEITSEHALHLHSSESEVYLSCNSNSPSPVVMDGVQKQACGRSISISSIEVLELGNQKKKAFSQSVPCLMVDKENVSKLPQTDECFFENIEKTKSSTAQSMICLNHEQDTFDEEENNSEKVTGKPLLYAEASWDHVTMNEEELCFTAGQTIAVYDIDDPQWWFGVLDDYIGWFPAAFVRIPVSGDLWNKYQSSVSVELSDQNKDDVSGENRRAICPSRDEIRAKIVDEIINTEQHYVRNLKDIVEGYLKQAKRRPDMFSTKLVETIFSNIESIYKFHMEFLRCIQNQSTDEACVGEIGEVFVKNRQSFSLYSEYCNNHPRAALELKNLLQQDKYRYFFEACRLLQEMIQISLDGFLLAPVQKICKYPLQLQELLKYTDATHTDYNNVTKALETMREVAFHINEEKRKVDNVKKIAEWQLSVEQWEGEDVLVKSSQLVHSGEVLKIIKGKAQKVTLFLFDHQLIICRKDVLKKLSLEYKGRIVLENYNFRKLEDGEVTHSGAPVLNAWRLSNRQSSASFLFQAESKEQRDKWIKYFLQERKIVYESTSGNSIPLEERRAAMDVAKNALQSEKQLPKGEKKYGKFNTVSRAIGQLNYGAGSSHQKVDLPPPVSSAMLFQRNQQGRSSLGPFRTSGAFKRKRPKGGRKSRQHDVLADQH